MISVLSIMCSNALWKIIEKTHFYDFDFSDEFIEMIQTDPLYDGLYEVLDLLICRKCSLTKNSYEEIKAHNPYPLVQQFIDIYNNNTQNITRYEEKKVKREKILEEVYAELDKSDLTDTYNPHINILLFLSHALSNTSHHKYAKHTTKYEAFNEVMKVLGTKNIDLIQRQIDTFNEKYPGVATRYFEFVMKRANLRNNNSPIMEIVICSEMLFPRHKTNTMMRVFCDLDKFKGVCLELSRNIGSKYDNYQLPCPPYPDFTDMIEHDKMMVRLSFDAALTHNNTKFEKYVRQLYDTNSNFLTINILVENIAIMYRKKEFGQVYQIFKQNKPCLMDFITHTPKLIAKLGLIYSIITSCLKMTRKTPIIEFAKIINTINPFTCDEKELVLYHETDEAVKTLKRINTNVERSGYSLMDNTQINETCLVCCVDIDDEDQMTIRCVCCRNQLGHIKCLSDWFRTNQTCPLCRSTIEQRKRQKI